MNEPLVTKADHLAGSKTLTVETRWGEQMTVEVLALSYRTLQRINAEALTKAMSANEHADLILVAAVSGDEELINKLEFQSAVKVRQVALALSLGERAIKNAPTPPQSQTEAVIPGSKSAGPPSAS